MPEVELVAQALAAGATAGMTQTVQQAARDAGERLVSLVRRDRGAPAAEEHPATEPGEAGGSAGAPVSGHRVGRYTLFANEIKGVVMGDNARQDNHFH
ncbi:hypothetical protein [Streptomyces liangshanensis]|uniref:Uncharacterized protein n=1 Tax=Streptomyces liangshanensis TaxID=2717324 RepID=A0A6G9GU24_9ACTN|nr:hypothetical protein [Streptomyces liangshanensis]QIQ01704.1 hypothetical protein HA039_04860 [Streptomyces liangshanensis]